MPDTKDVFLTKEGLQALKKELEDLQNKKRPNLVKRVAQARAMGDLSENSEYTSAREDLSMTDGRIEELEKILSQVKVIRAKKKKGRKQVGLGCQVKVKVNGETHVYDVVGEWEADPLKKKISHNSPLGKALLGKKKGEKVEIEAPAGKIVYEILGID
jgi:transcription elongation factor GreA